jgi:hypothetical protein
MENPLEVQKGLYGEDGPPMYFTPEASALHLEMRAQQPPSKRAKISCDPTERPSEGKSRSTESKTMSAGEIYAHIINSRASLAALDTSDGSSSSQQPSPCQLPGDFPPELSFRSLAAYSLLRTLSVQLRLSPFTPNAFLRALYLPAPNRLLGEIHVALLRILFVQKLKSMGYSYKAGGGGVGVIKRRQIDNIRWPLLAGDNLTHLDAHSWPLFYDDYCHLTADRLWASYRGSVDGDGDDGHDNQNFIDFRNIGVFVSPLGEQYQTKQHADGVTMPITISSGNTSEEYKRTKIRSHDGIGDQMIKSENVDEKQIDAQVPFHTPSVPEQKVSTELVEEIAMLNSDDSDSEDEYQDGDDDTEAWEKPKRKKRRRTAKKNTSTAVDSNDSGVIETTTKHTALASKEQKKNSTSWSRITSLESSISKPATPPNQKKAQNQNISSDPSWSRIASMEPSFSSPLWSPRQEMIERSQSQTQSHVPSSAAESDPILPKEPVINQPSQPTQIRESPNSSPEVTTTIKINSDDLEQSQTLPQPQPHVPSTAAASNSILPKKDSDNQSSQPTQIHEAPNFSPGGTTPIKINSDDLNQLKLKTTTIEHSQSQTQPHVPSSLAESDPILPKNNDVNQSSQPTQIREAPNFSPEGTTTIKIDSDDLEQMKSKTTTVESSMHNEGDINTMKSNSIDSGMIENNRTLHVELDGEFNSLSDTNTQTKNKDDSKSDPSPTDPTFSINTNSHAISHSSNELGDGTKLQIESGAIQSLAHTGTLASSSDESQHALSLTSAPLEKKPVEKALNEDQASKPAQNNLEIERSEQQQQQEQVTAKQEISKTTNILASSNPARIRGGGVFDDGKFIAPSNGGSSRQSMGRRKGSRRALPMHNNTSSALPTHAQHVSMLQLQQQQLQQQQFLFYQSQIHQNFGVSQDNSHVYPSSNQYSGEMTRDYRYQAPYNFESNKNMQMERGSLTSFKNDLQDLDIPFVVPDKIAKILNDFACDSSTHKQEGKDAEDVDVITDSDANNDFATDYEFEKELEMKRWLHFKPLKALRSGLPYHRLPPEDKVCILEFLIDELLTVDAISAEFTKRHNQAYNHESPYGILPKEDDYQNLENNDECVVCGQEGDLLCCDGCISSYHSCCLGMKVGQDLPEGKWLCPECSVIDPCNYGSLHGGRKGSLDWFELDDIVNTSYIQRTDRPVNPMITPLSSLNLSSNTENSPGLFMKKNLVKEMDIIGNSSDAPPGDTAGTAYSLSKSVGNKEFIVVHGFVFCREPTESNAKLDILKSSKPFLTLTTAELELFMSRMDDRVLQTWPFSQIPTTKATFSFKFPSLKDYFARNESINPFIYDNKYNRAPVSVMTKIGAVQNMTKLMYLTYESECNKPNTSKISEVLTENFTFDAKISSCLNTQTTLFDPYQFLKGYMFKLEQTLRRSCMLNEFWEGGYLKSRSEIWISRVRGAKSIQALSRLLLQLVNAMHSKAFLSNWFHSHIARSVDSESSISERNYKALPTDWTEEKEKRKRKWEMTPSKMILSLCSHHDNDLMGFASKIRSDIFIPKQINSKKSRSKRELKKAAALMKKLEVLKEVDERQSLHTEVGAKTKEESGTHKPEENTNSELVFAQQEERKIIDTEISSSNISTIAKGNDTIGAQAQREAVRDPKVEKSPEVTEVETKKQQHTNPKPLESSEREPDRTNVSFHVDTNCVDEENMTDASHLAKTPTQTNNVAAEAHRLPAENKFEEEKTLKSLGPCDDSTEMTDAIIPTEAAEGHTDTNSRTPDSSKKKKRKKSTKSFPREPFTRRRTRHSGRLSSEHSVENSTAIGASDQKDSNELDVLEGMALQIENAKKRKSPGLEKLLKGQYAIEGIWPIAGRRIFPTVGNLPPKGKFIVCFLFSFPFSLLFQAHDFYIFRVEMKSIARSAGTTVAANLSYHTNHEVAQVCYGHIWRKRVKLCNRFEELLYLMRLLESSLDRGVSEYFSLVLFPITNQKHYDFQS